MDMYYKGGVLRRKLKLYVTGLLEPVGHFLEF